MDPTLLIGDIVERGSDDKKPVEFPTAPISSTGFPQHKRRWKRSAFKQQRAGNTSSDTQKAQNGEPTSKGDVASQSSSFEEVERRRIDQENRQKIADMTPQEVAQAQDDLMSGLNPALVQRLLRRAQIDEDTGPSPFDPPKSEQSRTVPSVTVEDVEDASNAPVTNSPPAANTSNTTDSRPKKAAQTYDENKEPAQMPPDLFPIVDPPISTHFPVPPSLPDLSPDDPNFLATLHEKYFPNLPADPSKLAWMAPVPSADSEADKESPYYPHPEIGVSALRFDFRGRFLSPRVSRSIPSTKGLHHHGEAPEAAGYTVAELSHLARSSVPAQRCMAYQTLGRILYRLGKGEWGKGENVPIATGIWNAVKKGKALETLTEAAMTEGGHRGSRAYATEALWLYEKGGWRETFKGR